MIIFTNLLEKSHWYLPRNKIVDIGLDLFPWTWENGRVSPEDDEPLSVTPTPRQLGWEQSGPPCPTSLEGPSATPTDTHRKGQEKKQGKLWFRGNLEVIWMKMIGRGKLSPMKRKLRKFSFCTYKSSCQNFKVTTWMTRKEVNMEALGPWCLVRRHLHPYFGGERTDSLGITVSLGINVPSL